MVDNINQEKKEDDHVSSTLGATREEKTETFRRALGALKDSTKVGIVKVNSDYKAIDVALVKATNHDEVLPKEKHVRTLFDALSASRPRADVAYCIQALARRLAKTRSWTVALKTLIVIHRSMREVDLTVWVELSNYTISRSRILNISHLKDESSPRAWEYSAWVRKYALYLEECLECFRIVKYDIQRERTRTKRLDTPDLLEQLPAFQHLLFRLVQCQPEGASRYNFLIQYALSIIAAESVHLYVGITDGMLILVDKFFEMQRRDAVGAIEIYRKAMEQAEKISEFLETCRALDFGRGQKYVKIQQPPASFMTAMEEYVKDAPQTLMLPWKSEEKDGTTGQTTIVVEAKAGNGDENVYSDEEKLDSVSTSKVTNNESVTTPPVPDLLCLEDLTKEASGSDDKNALALAIIPPDQAETIQSASWELELVASTSTMGEVTESKLYQNGGLNRSLLDSLYDKAIANTNLNGTYQTGKVTSNPFEEADQVQDPTVTSNPFEALYAPSSVALVTDTQTAVAANFFQDPWYAPSAVAPGIHMQTAVAANFVQDPWYAPSSVAPGTDTQIAATAEDQESSMHLQPLQHEHQDQQLMVGNDSTDPFKNPLPEQRVTSFPSQSQSPYPSLI